MERPSPPVFVSSLHAGLIEKSSDVLNEDSPRPHWSPVRRVRHSSDTASQCDLGKRGAAAAGIPNRHQSSHLPDKLASSAMKKTENNEDKNSEKSDCYRRFFPISPRRVNYGGGGGGDNREFERLKAKAASGKLSSHTRERLNQVVSQQHQHQQQQLQYQVVGRRQKRHSGTAEKPGYASPVQYNSQEQQQQQQLMYAQKPTWSSVNNMDIEEFPDFSRFTKEIMEVGYTIDSLQAFECVYGQQFISIGGKKYTSRALKDINLPKESRVLDVGCGIGGPAIVMARDFGAIVTGIDISPAAIAFANKNQGLCEPEVKYRLQFLEQDATVEAFPDSFFDVVVSRDALMHIMDKRELFGKLYKTLKPGGTLLITDIATSEAEKKRKSSKFVGFDDNYDTLPTINEYAKLLKSVGFVDVNCSDMTEDYVALTKDELARWEGFNKDADSETMRSNLEALRTWWEMNLDACSTGQMRWAQYTAKKPAKKISVMNFDIVI